MNIPRNGQPDSLKRQLFFFVLAWVLFFIFSVLDPAMNPGEFRAMKSPHQGIRFEEGVAKPVVETRH